MARKMYIKPCTITDAKAFIATHHRHNAPPMTGLFATSVVDHRNAVVGVGVCSRPVARALNDGWTCEISRVCTDGTPMACSMIYGSLCRAAKALGYRKVVTYTLKREPGTSLKASNFKQAGETKGRTWDTPTRRRNLKVMDLFGTVKKYQPEDKYRWERNL